MALTLEQVIPRVPFFANAMALKSTALPGGITNLNYRVDADENSYVLRISGADTELLGIRRDVEYAANLAAGILGIAPEVMYFIEPEGYLVTRFVDGVKIPPEEMVKPRQIRRVAEKLRRFHSEAPRLEAEFNVFRRVQMLAEISRHHNCQFPASFGWMMDKLHTVEESFSAGPSALNPCHDDLLNLNFLDEQGDIRILDWEYAGMGDIFFDLANFSHHHRLSDDQVRSLLEAYFGEAKPQTFARLKLMWPISEMHEAMWGTAQSGISRLAEDFQGYANLWFGRAAEALQDARWDQWMKDFASVA